MRPSRARLATLALTTWLLAAAGSPSSLAAQAPELVTDRPDQTESSAVVAPGSVQIETGVGYSRAGGAGIESETAELGATLVRIGLADRLELRVGWGGLIDESAVGAAEGGSSGAADVDLGFKLRLADEDGPRPALALLAATSLPTGAEGVGSGRADPALLLSASHTLSDVVGLGYNAGAVWETGADETGDRDTTYDWVYSLAAGFAVGEGVGSFVEIFGRVPGSAGGRGQASLDGGLTWLLRPNRQLDLFAGVGLSGDAPDWFAGLGFSIRLPE